MKTLHRFLLGIGIFVAITIFFYHFSLKDVLADIQHQEDQFESASKELDAAHTIIASYDDLVNLNQNLATEAAEMQLDIDPDISFTASLQSVLHILKTSGCHINGIHPIEGQSGFSIKFVNRPSNMESLLANLQHIPGKLQITEFNLKINDNHEFEGYLKFEVTTP